ncbi:unnamed protein product [Ixodes pacificus]
MCRCGRGQTKTGSGPPTDTEATATFSEAVGALRSENVHTHYSVECVDPIVVCVDHPAARMDDAACESSVQVADIGCALRRVTMALLQRQQRFHLQRTSRTDFPESAVCTKDFSATREEMAGQSELRQSRTRRHRALFPGQQGGRAALQVSATARRRAPVSLLPLRQSSCTAFHRSR